MGLDGVDGPDFDACTERVWERLGVNTHATHHNRNTECMIAALTERGYSYEPLARNASQDDDPRFCGYCNLGCQQGCKRSVLHTYLEDAARAGARFIVNCHAQRILTESGHAAGVEAIVDTPHGRTDVRVSASTVVVAAGGIESPALLLRSGLGGPATGANLRVHPSWIVTGVYDEPIEAWSGQIQSAVSFDLADCESDAGFLLESLALSPTFWASQSPFVDGRRHREELLKLRYMATWHAVSHDHGSGRVSLDAQGRSIVAWKLDDEVDQRVAVRAHAELARLHRAAGAGEIFTFHWREQRWRRPDSFDGFLSALASAPFADYTAYSAHQMGSCRMGASIEDSVADGRGELHDTPGVWIGDASALPTAPGVNPMITIMALAERTAALMLREPRSG
jgi:choline dehydrogenase-like flavoprotein